MSETELKNKLNNVLADLFIYCGNQNCETCALNDPDTNLCFIANVSAVLKKLKQKCGE